MTDSRDLPEFDPLAVENVGVTLAVELLEQPLQPMPPPEPFAGAGVYALYYAGNHPAYAGLTALDGGRFKYPVYIGKGLCCTKGVRRRLPLSPDALIQRAR